MTQGFDRENAEFEEDKIPEAQVNKRKPFAYWKVGDREYKMKLTASIICRLEDKYKKNLMMLMDTTLPLAVMLTIAQAAMEKYEHGITYAKTQTLFDQYCDEGGTQLSFLNDVILDIYRVSGFFSDTQQEQLESKMEEVKTMM